MPMCFICALCGKDFEEEGEIFSTWGVFLPRGHTLYKYCDACFHWSCYEIWPERSNFANAYFAFWLAHDKASGLWKIIDASADHLLSANLTDFDVALLELATGRKIAELVDDPNYEQLLMEAYENIYQRHIAGEDLTGDFSKILAKALTDTMTPGFWLCLRETGSRLSIPIDSWESWVSDLAIAGKNRHRLEQDAINRILPTLQANIGTLHKVCRKWFDFLDAM
jgi:hypothetical protein